MAAVRQSAHTRECDRKEIARLSVSDVTEDGGLVVRQGKTAAAVRRIPIHPALQSLIDRLMRADNPFSAVR